LKAYTLATVNEKFPLVVLGRQFDKDGNLVEWWSPAVVNNFKEKAQCIIDQYGRYVMPQINQTVGP